MKRIFKQRYFAAPPATYHNRVELLIFGVPLSTTSVENGAENVGCSHVGYLGRCTD